MPDNKNYQTIKVHNDSGEKIPDNAVMQVTDGELVNNVRVLNVDKPSGTDGQFLINRRNAIAIDRTGTAFEGVGMVALVTGTPSVGDEIGPVNDSWSMSGSGSGFVVLGDVRDSRCRVMRIGGGGGDSSPTYCPHTTAKIINCTRREAKAMEVLYLNEEDRDELEMQTRYEELNQSAQIEIVHKETWRQINGVSVLEHVQRQFDLSSVDILPTDLILIIGPSGISTRYEEFENLEPDSVPEFGKNASEWLAAGEVFNQSDAKNLSAVSELWGDYFLTNSPSKTITFGTLFGVSYVAILVLRNVARRKIAPEISTPYPERSEVELLGGGDPTWDRIEDPQIPWEDRQQILPLASDLTVSSVRSSSKLFLLRVFLTFHQGSGGPYVNGYFPTNDFEVYNDWYIDQHGFGGGSRWRIDLVPLNGTESITFDEPNINKNQSETGAYNDVYGAFYMFEASESPPLVSLDNSCKPIKADSPSQIEAIYDNYDNYKNHVAAESTLARSRNRQPVVLLGSAKPGKETIGVVDGYALMWAYISNPDHKFIGPPPENATRKEKLDPADGDIHGWLGKYYNKEGRYFSGWPFIGYSQTKPSSILIQKAWRSHSHRNADQSLSVPREITLTVKMRKTDGVLYIRDLEMVDQDDEAVYYEAESGGESFNPGENANLIFAGDGKVATETLIKGDLWAGLKPHSHRPKYFDADNLATVGPSEAVGRGTVDLKCGLWEYTITDDRVDELSEDEEIEETWTITERHSWMTDLPETHPFVYGNPEISGVTAPSWPEFPIQDPTPSSAYEADNLTPPALDDDFDPMLGRKYADGDQRIGLQLVTVKIDSNYFRSTSGNCC